MRTTFGGQKKKKKRTKTPTWALWNIKILRNAKYDREMKVSSIKDNKPECSHVMIQFGATVTSEFIGRMT